MLKDINQTTKGVKMKTKEALETILNVMALMAETFKDGIQAKDALEIIKKIDESPDLKAAMLELYNNIDGIKDEMNEVTLAEGLELLGAAIPGIVKIIEVLKK